MGPILIPYRQVFENEMCENQRALCRSYKYTGVLCSSESQNLLQALRSTFKNWKRFLLFDKHREQEYLLLHQHISSVLSYFFLKTNKTKKYFRIGYGIDWLSLYLWHGIDSCFVRFGVPQNWRTNIFSLRKF